jgi:sugar/nucleoside kinase (ribokinase family)
MLGNGVTQLFCNEEEALAWTGTDRLDIAATELSDVAQFVNITLGARGSLAVSPGARQLAPGRGAHAVDTTGAGDIYAGAFLYARNSGAPPSDAAGFANFAAAHLVTVHGARLPDLTAYDALRRAFTRP